MDLKLRELYFKELKKEISELIDQKTKLLDQKYSNIINCPLCKAEFNSHKKLFVKNGYTFVRCSNCEMIFTNPQVKLSFLNELYGKSKANDIWVEIQESKFEQSWKQDYFIQQIDLLSNECKLKNISLLDIGCSTGFFLEQIKEHKSTWSAKGIEISKKAYNFAKKKGLNVDGKLLHELNTNENYNVFTLFGVIEHLAEPNNIFNDIKRYSKKESYILAIVPNIYSLYHMFIQSKSVSLDGRNHLLYFSEKTLKKLFVEKGYEIIKLDTVLTGKDNILRQIQWFEPYSNINTNEFIPERIKYLFENNVFENFLYKNNLGLRLRILAKYTK